MANLAVSAKKGSCDWPTRRMSASHSTFVKLLRLAIIIIRITSVFIFGSEKLQNKSFFCLEDNLYVYWIYREIAFQEAIMVYRFYIKWFSGGERVSS